MMEDEVIGELTLRSNDARDEVYSMIVKNSDNVSEDVDGFSPVRRYVQAECFEVAGCTRVLKGTFKDIINKQNNLNTPYKLVLTVVYEQ